MKYINSNKLNEIKLNKDNFYVLIDFDRTITKVGSISCWRILRNYTFLSSDFRKEYDKIHDMVIPNGDDILKSKYFEDRFKGYLKLYEKHNLNEEIIDNAVKDTPLVFRDKAKDFFAKMYELKIPVIIISCSIKNGLEKVLRMHDCYFDNIEIYANYFDYSLERNHIYNVTPYNKSQIAISDNFKNKINKRKNIVLIGDSIGDISMVSQDKLQNTITIGFLDKDIEKNLEMYNANFDVVLTNNSGFEDVMDLLGI